MFIKYGYYKHYEGITPMKVDGMIDRVEFVVLSLQEWFMDGEGI